jgi:hypothetical protein
MAIFKECTLHNGHTQLKYNILVVYTVRYKLKIKTRLGIKADNAICKICTKCSSMEHTSRQRTGLTAKI